MKAVELLDRPIPSRDLAKELGMSTRQIRKARVARQCGIPCQALDNVAAAGEVELSADLKIAEVEQSQRVAIQSAHRRAGQLYSAWREFVNFERSEMFVRINQTSEEDREHWGDAFRDEFEALKTNELVVKEMARLFIVACDECSRLGVPYPVTKDWKRYRDIQSGQKSKPRHKKGSDDLHGHHKPSHQQLVEAVGDVIDRARMG